MFGTTLVIWSWLITFALCFPDLNSLTDRPMVQCGKDEITVNVHSSQPFKGRLYVQGESDDGSCVRSADQSITVAIGSCNMRRQRSLQPRGVSFTFTLIVSFHPLFVTGADRAFHIRCFYLESVKNLHHNLNIQELSTETIDETYDLPKCGYHLRSPMGHVDLAHVGDTVTHEWSCDRDAGGIYGILVHSCYADDGKGQRHLLVDNRGCSTDEALIPHLIYDGMTVHTEGRVFKYADKVQVFFTCTIQLCYKHDGGCDGITPPSCGAHGPGSSAEEHQVHPEPRGEPDHSAPKPPPIPEMPEIPQIPDIPHMDRDFFRPMMLPPMPQMKPPSVPAEGWVTLTDPGTILTFRLPYKDSPLIDEAPIVMERNETSQVSDAVQMQAPISEYEASTVLTETSALEDAVFTEPLVKETENANAVLSKKRRDARLETDLSVDVMVLPPIEKRNYSIPQQLSPPTLDLCSSKEVQLGLVLILLILIILSGSVSFYVARRHFRRILEDKIMSSTAF